MASHTKGPWKVECMSSTIRVTRDTGSEFEDDVAVVGKPSHQAAADARLIAAAPDLLNALVCLLNHPANPDARELAARVIAAAEDPTHVR